MKSLLSVLIYMYSRDHRNMRPGSSWGYLLDLGPEQGSQRKKRDGQVELRAAWQPLLTPAALNPWAHTLSGQTYERSRTSWAPCCRRSLFLRA